MTSTDLTVPAQLVDPRTGELHPATPDRAVELLQAAREMRQRILGLVKDCEAVLLEESRRQGSKTLHLQAGTATISGGSRPEWDLDVLLELRDLGLPEERYQELVVAKVTYEVKAGEAKRLAAANPDYAKVIERARSTVDAPWRVTVK